MSCGAKARMGGSLEIAGCFRCVRFVFFSWGKKTHYANGAKPGIVEIGPFFGWESLRFFFFSVIFPHLWEFLRCSAYDVTFFWVKSLHPSMHFEIFRCETRRSQDRSPGRRPAVTASMKLENLRAARFDQLGMRGTFKNIL